MKSLKASESLISRPSGSFLRLGLFSLPSPSFLYCPLLWSLGQSVTAPWNGNHSFRALQQQTIKQRIQLLCLGGKSSLKQIFVCNSHKWETLLGALSTRLIHWSIDYLLTSKIFLFSWCRMDVVLFPHLSKTNSAVTVTWINNIPLQKLNTSHSYELASLCVLPGQQWWFLFKFCGFQA